ncbi:hypothetical protein BS50DRAFT_324017 [Corynespora cassiicola Philippines]|uniref:Apple domain-containing protein n=1 Tax=Corynespora cassiicola Philippines TaxID=1448308 RepID=A0A2T2NTK5_CORCC|nr:hypothetical protein BS50DRAFT_324017 [Corynespora cassiicola Philippines]
MLISTFILTAVITAVAALPTATDLTPRAGGPTAKPIPPTCSVTNPLPLASADKSYIPGDSVKDVQLYSAYYPSPSPNKTALAQQCLEQCYGYGDSTQCKSAFWAENVPTPPGYYGTPGGQLLTACLMYTRPLEGGDFAVAPGGQATDAFAGNIAC